MHATYDRDHKSRIHPCIGIIGGGQLAKMTILAGQQMGCEFVVLEKNRHSPALQVTSRAIVGNWDDPELLLNLAAATDVITFENEFVSANALAALEARGTQIFPKPSTLATIQDKLVQKQELARAGIPVPKFRGVQSPTEVLNASLDLGWPMILKKRRNGYDGKGNVTLRSAADVSEAWQLLDGAEDQLMVEEFCRFAQELAMIITRAKDGSMAAYPLVESRQENHICRSVLAPADVISSITSNAEALAKAAVRAVDAVGSIGIEMFLLNDGRVLLNELAPRVHNSGHYTIEACESSQFENHVRAILGWPLGKTTMRAPAAVMVNLLGSTLESGGVLGMKEALSIPGAHIHLYSKTMSGPLRKMGHVTALGPNSQEALSIAQRAAEVIRFGNI